MPIVEIKLVARRHEAAITPPFGLLLFVVANMTKKPLMSIVREATPFIFVEIVVLAIITFVPQTILWLPRVMGYKG